MNTDCTIFIIAHLLNKILDYDRMFLYGWNTLMLESLTGLYPPINIPMDVSFDQSMDYLIDRSNQGGNRRAEMNLSHA